MKITLQTMKYNNPYNDRFNDNSQRNNFVYSNNSKPQSFGSKDGSKVFAWFGKMSDVAAEKIAKWFTPILINNRLIQKAATKFQDSKNLLTHSLAVGSIITSGVYMTTTLRNHNLDKDRKKTLAINQGLTSLVSLILSYSAEKALAKKWNAVTNRFAAIQLNDKNLFDTAKEKSLNPKFDISEYINTTIKEGKIEAKAGKLLKAKIGGMGVLKSTIIFASIFRYIVPVTITPIANVLGDRHLAKKKATKVAMATTQTV